MINDPELLFITMGPKKTCTDLGDGLVKHLEQYRYVERTAAETKRLLGLIEMDRVAGTGRWLQIIEEDRRSKKEAQP
jgi:hypothetical protein